MKSFQPCKSVHTHHFLFQECPSLLPPVREGLFAKLRSLRLHSLDVQNPQDKVAQVCVNAGAPRDDVCLYAQTSKFIAMRHISHYVIEFNRCSLVTSRIEPIKIRYYTVRISGKDQTFRTALRMRRVVWHMHYVIFTCARQTTSNFG